MQLRAYIQKPAADHLETLSRLQSAASRVGSISSTVLAPYWKIDSLEEAIWDIVLTQQPDAALSALLQELGTGWQHYSDGALLDCRHGGDSLPGISSIFIDVAYQDWGRFHGVNPRFEFHQRVRVASVMADQSGCVGCISGHAFDRDSLSWSYGVLLDSDGLVHDFPEAALDTVDTP
jgi:hypothetical protein